MLFAVTKIRKCSLLHFTIMLTLSNTPRYFPSNKFLQRGNLKQGKSTGLDSPDHKEQQWYDLVFKKLIIKKCSLSKIISTFKIPALVHDIPGRRTTLNKLSGGTARASKTTAISPQWLVAKSFHEDMQHTYSSGQNLLSISLTSEHKAEKKDHIMLTPSLKSLN